MDDLVPIHMAVRILGLAREAIYLKLLRMKQERVEIKFFLNFIDIFRNGRSYSLSYPT